MAQLRAALGRLGEEGIPASWRERLLGRARDLQRVRPRVPLKRLVLLDATADPRTKALALRAASGRLTNPARPRFWAAHAGPLSRFYSNIPAEVAEGLASA